MDCIMVNLNGVRQQFSGEKQPDELMYIKNWNSCKNLPQFRKTLLQYITNFNEQIDRIYLSNWRDPSDWESKQSYVVLAFILLDDAERIRRHFLGKVDPKVKVDLAKTNDFGVITQTLDVLLKSDYDAHFKQLGMKGFDILEDIEPTRKKSMEKQI